MQGNLVLKANHVHLADPWDTSALFTKASESELIADQFNGGPSHLYSDEVQEPPTRFLTYVSYDYFLNNLAQDISILRSGEPVPRRFKVVNNLDSRHSGLHWVTVVYDMKRREKGTSPLGLSAALVEAADRTSLGTSSNSPVPAPTTLGGFLVSPSTAPLSFSLLQDSIGTALQLASSLYESAMSASALLILLLSMSQMTQREARHPHPGFNHDAYEIARRVWYKETYLVS